MRRTNEPGRFARSRGNTLALAALVGLVGALIPATAWGESAATPTPEPGFTAVPDETMTSPETTSTSAPEPTPSALPVPTPTQTAGPAPQESAAADEATTVPDPTNPASYGGDTTEDEAQPGGYAGPEGFQATSLVGWKAGNIISDAKMFASGTMSTAQIQTFLNGKVPKCQSGYVCLKDYKQNTITKAATTWCPGTYQGAQAESAASIISKAAKACGVNEQVLLVMLQKEQGLVTHVWPSDWRYTIAMGYACPDNAACDTAYYGFQNQMYMAASQLKRYTMDSWFNWYPVGRTSNVRWHPNASCGSGPVFIENKATAALYYYTPYQPNAAALRAGYGEGDSCSAYGNRNFYNYFTDWFGSTGSTPTLPSSGLVKAGNDVYLLTRGGKYAVGPTVINEYTVAFGKPMAVSAVDIAGLETFGRATKFIRNADTGDVAFLGGTQKHQFRSCAQVAAFGSACNAETLLPPSDYNRFATGPVLTWFVRLAVGGEYHLIEDGVAYLLADSALARALNGGQMPYTVVLPSEGVAKYVGKVTSVRRDPRVTVEPAGSTRTYLPTWDGRLLYVPNWKLATEMGIVMSRRVSGVSSTELRGYTTQGELSFFVTCDGQRYVAAGGVLHRVTASAATGFATANVGTKLCKVAPIAAGTLNRVFIQGEGRNEVYVADGGKFRHVTSRARITQLNGGVWPSVLAVDPGLVDWLPKGALLR